MAGLPAATVQVRVGPPLSARAFINGLELISVPAFVQVVSPRVPMTL